MTGARILVVDDDPSILRALELMLKQAHYDVSVANCAADGLATMARRLPDVILLDLVLPDMDGLSLIHTIREKNSIPIIMLSSAHQEKDKVAALDAGADDYITKPFGTAEVRSRIRAVLRRWAKSDGPRAQFVHGELVVDFERREVKVSEVPVHLTPKEYDLLKFMIEHADKVLTHRMLLTALWGPSHADQAQYLRVFVGQLRKKIERQPIGQRLIVTEPGVGYRFCLDL